MNGPRVPVLAILGVSAAITSALGAALFALAALVPRRKLRRGGSAAHANYFLHPTLYARFFSIGDVFLVCFCAVLLAASAREIWSHWRALSEAAVLEERWRIARDLHDGPAQDLAYLLRSLNSLNGVVDKDTKAHRASSVGGDLRITSAPGPGPDVEALL